MKFMPGLILYVQYVYMLERTMGQGGLDTFSGPWSAPTIQVKKLLCPLPIFFTD